MPPADDDLSGAAGRPLDAVTDPARLRAVRSSGLLDSRPDDVHDQLVRLASQLLHAPVAVLTVVDERHSTWRASVGVVADRRWRVEASICRHVIDAAAAVAIGDTEADARTKDDPAIPGTGIRAWAGHPLLSPDGLVLGSFAVADHVPREWTALDLETLRVLSGAATAQIALAAGAVREQRARDQRLAQASDLLSAHERQLAEVLQRSMLSTLPVLAELELHGCYRPAGGTAHVGGDWYDAVDLGAGRTALVIGDVMGRGLRAVAVMGQLRTAVRTLARLDLEPRQVLGLLDELVAELGDDQLATCFYGVHDAASSTLDWCSAGHPPPVVRRGGRTARLPGPPGSPLGVGGPGFVEHSDHLRPGEVLCLFTDGLIEDRNRDLDVGLDLVEQVLDTAGDDLPAVATRLVREVSSGEDDDVALLLARVAGRAAPEAEPGAARVLTLDLAEGPSIVATARHWVRAALLAWHGEADHVGTVELLTSELVTNALLHARPPVRLRLRAAPGAVFIEVFDQGSAHPQLQRARLEDERGRGILLLDALAHRWGSRSSRGGKVVWAEVSVQEPPGDGDWTLPRMRGSD